jgi:hypothetical protein
MKSFKRVLCRIQNNLATVRNSCFRMGVGNSLCRTKQVKFNMINEIYVLNKPTHFL